jgi:hypothetical protein
MLDERNGILWFIDTAKSIRLSRPLDKSGPEVITIPNMNKFWKVYYYGTKGEERVMLIPIDTKIYLSFDGDVMIPFTN